VKTEIVSAVRAGLAFSGSDVQDPGQTGRTARGRAESNQQCAKAVKLLRAGEVVALPTETVYGLAADALNPDAVAKIFEAKERPRFDPLIVHLPRREALEEIATVDSPIVSQLIEEFWPGPLTIILRRRAIVPDIVTAGLDTVAVRISTHPVFREVVSALNRPLAAPSANRFGRISPTTAQHVLEELGGRIPLIVDGGMTEHGLESTIVRIRTGVIDVLRQGPVTGAMLARFAEVCEAVSSGFVIAPGQLPSHYAPRTRLLAVENLKEFVAPAGKRIGVLARSSASVPPPSAAIRYLSESGDLREAATNLFGMLRELDAENLDLIVAELMPEEGIGLAINDRLRRAAT
jgi:L-threonylcarbamoyladenylate synthase